MIAKQDFERTTALLLDEVPAVLGNGWMTTGEWEGPDDAILGSIGFGGVDLRGSLVLIARSGVWRAMAPLVVSPSTELLCDMVAELCNMVAGRFRNRLLRLGVDIQYGIPTSTCGHLSMISLPRTAALNVVSRRFETIAGAVYLRTDLLFRDQFVYPTVVNAALEPAEVDLFF